MNSKRIVTASVVAIASLVVSNVASAEEKDAAQPGAESSRDLSPVKHAVELTVGTGYEQGFGNIGAGLPSLTDLGQAGGAIQVGVGYRIIPQLTLGVYGSGAVFDRGAQVDTSTNIYSASAGFQADWHVLPGGHALDPWLSLGSGWRGYWLDANQGVTAMHGIEIAKLQLGVDYRIDKSVAISPVFGVDLSTFLTESTPATNAFNNIQNPTVTRSSSLGFRVASTSRPTRRRRPRWLQGEPRVRLALGKHRTARFVPERDAAFTVASIVNVCPKHHTRRG
jgi:hypothetical protein